MTDVAIDLFAGGGGFTTGAEMAGLTVRWVANHYPLAVEYHTRNHPHIEHVCQDLMVADFTKVPPHGWLLASPACTGHTPSRGKDRPHHDASRSTAWAVVSCAEVHRPNVIVVENVPEFATRWVTFPASSAAAVLPFGTWWADRKGADHGRGQETAGDPGARGQPERQGHEGRVAAGAQADPRPGRRRGEQQESRGERPRRTHHAVSGRRARRLADPFDIRRPLGFA